jgi:hypothetical protein
MALLDRAEICDVIGRYSYAMDTRDWDLFRTCFTDEIQFEPIEEWARDDAKPTKVRAEDFVEASKAFMAEMPHSQHIKIPVSFDLRGDEATVISLLQGKHYMPNLKGEAISAVIGYYRDEWVRTTDGWRQASFDEIVFWHEGNWHVSDVAVSNFLRTMNELTSSPEAVSET